jgi:hypothetical protein
MDFDYRTDRLIFSMICTLMARHFCPWNIASFEFSEYLFRPSEI